MEFKTLVKRADFLAPSIQLSFKNKRSQGTMVGGYCSLLLVLVISYYAVSSIYEL